jgi:DNA topoisomerase-1
MSRLVIVESPAKARTIAGYLGPDYVVESSIGHVRDLPERAADIPAEHKKKPWARLGVDVENDFEPLYIVDPDKKKVIADLRKKLADADELLLATDEDREGEAIAWHLLEILRPKVPVRRMVFHEITREAIEEALGHTREIDKSLVDAQETRRILDRLYGYEVSPVLWKKVTQGLSAGRVQSVATRLVVERERERMKFVAAEYWDVEGRFDPGGFTARLAAVDGRRVAQGRDFGQDGTLGSAELVHLREADARGLAERLDGAPFAVRSVERKPYSRRPAAPFMTSTLQQEASRKLRFSSQTTMRVAQRLYENGYITYMRTDSTTLAESALTAAREQARELFGAEFVPPSPRRYDRKVKNAQEAHEAIRPAGTHFRTPDQVRRELGPDEIALYELIWRRTIASQMADAKGETVSVRLGARSSSGEDAEFATAGTVITFKGFLAAYEEGRDEEPEENGDERRLPQLTQGQELEVLALEPQGHATTPPPRYTEATLVRALEELGIGRPSTYAAIIGTILDRGYVAKKGTALVPTFLAFSVVQLLERHFERLVDYGFTASMEDDLDRIAAGDEAGVEWLRRFYFGADEEEGLHALVSDLSEIDARSVNSFPVGEDTGIVLRVGRYGPYLERDGARANVPPDLAPDELTVERALELLSKPSEGRSLGRDPETGHEIVAREGRYGPYVTDGETNASLRKTDDPETVTIERAAELLAERRSKGPSQRRRRTARRTS